MSPAPIPPRCPSCGAPLLITRLACSGCGTEITGEYEPCKVCCLENDDRRLFGLFLSARGNVKQVQRELGVSYPTARQRVDDLFVRLGCAPSSTDPMDVLRKLRSGEIDVDAAERLLRGTKDRT